MRFRTSAVIGAIGSLLILSAAAYAQPGRWTEVNRNDEVAQSIDRQSIARTGNKVRIWQRNVYSAPEDDIASSLFLNEYDCTARTFALAAWADEDAEGTRMGSGTISREEMEIYPVLPDSFAETIFEIVCE
ncbi:surface-adhesin E family protein [Allosphingosinicella sp.]|jgi:hypothetical protein|uniref:surface-adhesin E family protein n=1 Tax=Allosphingosinicella sp. TaxID=2823234 RepID=UPI002EE2FCF0